MTLPRKNPLGPVAYCHVANRQLRQLPDNTWPAPGAHLVTPWLGFAHHGLYVGEGRVIHYGALMYDIIRRPVEEVSLQQFSGGRPVFLVLHAESTFDAEEVIRRARSRLGEKRYRLFSNNCEHFVEWCLHGVSRSFQAETALSYPRTLGDRIEAWCRAGISALVPGRQFGLGAGPAVRQSLQPQAISLASREQAERSGSHADKTSARVSPNR